MRVIKTLGAATCLAGSEDGCDSGPHVLRRSGMIGALARRHGVRLEWRRLLTPRPELGLEASVADLCRRIHQRVRNLVEDDHPFLFMGGDHSCAMGVWSGVMRGMPRARDLGLIWIDAHMDAHTFETTPSENIHGMPVAALLGQADQRLAQIYGNHPRLYPSQLVIIGARSFEPPEQALLKRLGVRVCTMGDIYRKGGLRPLLLKEIARLRHRCRRYGISIDLDAVDPDDAPGVSSAAPGGLSGAALCRALAGLGGDPALIGLEISEFNPRNDRGHRTERLVEQLIGAVYGETLSAGEIISTAEFY
jgi:arginase